MLTEALASHVVESEPTAEARHAAVRCVVDWAGCALAGAGHDAVRAVASVLPALGSSNSCTLVGRSDRAAAVGAALVNGTASHVLDYDDVLVAAIGHPGVVVVPPVLALAEADAVDGATVVDAIVAGYDVMARLGDIVNPLHYEQGWHATATLGCMSAAAAGARVLGLDVRRTARSLSIAATQAGGLRAMFGTHGKAFHAGRAASAGVLSAELARANFVVPDEVLEGEAGYLAVASVSEQSTFVREGSPAHAITEVAFKGHAACGATHCLVDAVHELVSGRAIDPHSIVRIEARVHPLAIRAAGIEAPRTALEAKFSLSHVAAMAVFHHPLSPGLFSDDNSNLPELVALRERVQITPDGSLAYEQAMPAAVRIVLDGGESFETYVDAPRGRPANPMSDAELEAKFLAQAVPVLGDLAAADLVNDLWAIGESADVRRTVSGLGQAVAATAIDGAGTRG